MVIEHEHSLEAMHTWIHVQTALLGVIFLLVLTLNSLLMFVLRKMKSRRSKRDRASYNIERSYMYLLFHLALADMLGVILNIIFDILGNAGVKYNISNASCQVLPPFQLASTTAQAGTYVALSYHRFRAIVHPIKAKLTVYRSLIWIGIIWVISVALSVPFVIVQTFDEAKKSCKEVWGKEIGSNIYTFSIFVVQYAAPVTLMAGFYIAIARTLHQHRAQKELVHVPTQDDVRSHRHIVKMLVAIVTVYSVCMLPHHLFWIVAGVQQFEGDAADTIESVSYLFTYSNSVANPVVFFFYNKESRYHLKRFFKLLCRCCAQNMDVPFEIKKWSATWSGHSRSDQQNYQERRSSKDHLKLDQLFLAKPGDSDLGVSLPWEAQVIHSHSSEEHNYSPSSPSLPVISLSPGNPFESPINETANPFRNYGVPESTMKQPTIDRENDNTDKCEDDNDIEIVIGADSNDLEDRGFSKDIEEDGRSEQINSEKEGEIFIHSAQKVEEAIERESVSDAPCADDETEVASSCSDDDAASSEDDTARVQLMIERMMQDIRHELKQDNGVNGMKRLEDILNLNDSSSNGDWDAIINGECLNGSLGHLGTSQDMNGLQEHSVKDIYKLRERLDSLPETRM